MSVTLLGNDRTVRIALKRVLECCATIWRIAVAQGYDRLLFPKSGTVRGMLEHGPLTLVLGQIGEEE
jgi:hypothetical protein